MTYKYRGRPIPTQPGEGAHLSEKRGYLSSLPKLPKQKQTREEVNARTRERYARKRAADGKAYEPRSEAVREGMRRDKPEVEVPPKAKVEPMKKRVLRYATDEERLAAKREANRRYYAQNKERIRAKARAEYWKETQ